MPDEERPPLESRFRPLLLRHRARRDRQHQNRRDRLPHRVLLAGVRLVTDTAVMPSAGWKLFKSRTVGIQSIS
jgi:hypothetical protein